MRRNHRVRGAPDGSSGDAPRAYRRGARKYEGRGGVWYAYLPERKGAISLRTRDEREAERQFRGLLERGIAPRVGKATEVPLSAIGQQYIDASHGWTESSKRTTEPRVIAFVEAMERMGITLPSQITAKALGDWRKARESIASRGTINRDEGVAKRMLVWARTERQLCGVTAVESIRKMRESKAGRTKVLPPDDVVLQHADWLETHSEALAAWTIRAGYVSGFRLEELHHTDESDVHDGHVYVTPESGPAATAWQSKGFAERRVKLSPEGVATMLAFVRCKATTKGKNGTTPGLTSGWLRKKIDLARKAIPSIAYRAHDLRRLFATAASRSGVPIKTIAGWLGHVDVSTTERYVLGYGEDRETTAPTHARIVQSCAMSAGFTNENAVKHRVPKPKVGSSILPGDAAFSAVECTVDASGSCSQLLGFVPSGALGLCSVHNLTAPAGPPIVRGDTVTMGALECSQLAEFERTGMWS